MLDEHTEHDEITNKDNGAKLFHNREPRKTLERPQIWAKAVSNRILDVDVRCFRSIFAVSYAQID